MQYQIRYASVKQTVITLSIKHFITARLKSLTNLFNSFIENHKVEPSPQSRKTKVNKKNHFINIKDYDKAIEINPNDALAYYNRGNAKANIPDYSGAIKDYDKAIEINPNFADAYINRGVAKGRLIDHQGAIEDYSKTIELNPNEDIAYYNRGLAKNKLGDKEGACLDWKKAGELGYNNAYNLIDKYCK